MSHPSDILFPDDTVVYLSELYDPEKSGPVVFRDNDEDFLVVAPAPSKGCFYFGIVRGYPFPQKFIHGPAIARQNRIWSRIRAINPAINADDCFLEFSTPGDVLTKAPSLDHFIDLVNSPAVMKAGPEHSEGEEWKEADE